MNHSMFEQKKFLLTCLCTLKCNCLLSCLKLYYCLVYKQNIYWKTVLWKQLVLSVCKELGWFNKNISSTGRKLQIRQEPFPKCFLSTNTFTPDALLDPSSSLFALNSKKSYLNSVLCALTQIRVQIRGISTKFLHDLTTSLSLKWNYDAFVHPIHIIHTCCSFSFFFPH